MSLTRRGLFKAALAGAILGAKLALEQPALPDSTFEDLELDIEPYSADWTPADLENAEARIWCWVDEMMWIDSELDLDTGEVTELGRTVIRSDPYRITGDTA